MQFWLSFSTVPQAAPRLCLLRIRRRMFLLRLCLPWVRRVWGFFEVQQVCAYKCPERACDVSDCSGLCGERIRAATAAAIGGMNAGVAIPTPFTGRATTWVINDGNMPMTLRSIIEMDDLLSRYKLTPVGIKAPPTLTATP